MTSPEHSSSPSIPLRVIGACPHDCPDTCAFVTEVRDGRAVRIEASKEHPVTQGWLCAKVSPYLERVYHPDRLTHPLRRVGPKGSDQWERISWGEAIGEIASRWQAIIAEHGGAAILPYSYSGTLGLVQNFATSARLWNRLGASGLDRTICDAAGTAAMEVTVGGKVSPPPHDLLKSKLILIWGHNPVSTAPHMMPIIREAQRDGAQVVVIDPYRTRTARSADWHLQPHPGSDAALALGLMHVIFGEELHDEAWLDAHALGWHDLRDRAKEYPPERVATLTGIAVEDIVRLARLWATTTPAILKFSDGLQRNLQGGQSVRAVLALPALTGQYGVVGGGIFYAQSGWIQWDEEALGHAAECPPVPRIVNMNRLGSALTGEIDEPPIKSLYVFAANPVTSTPNASAIVRGMQRDDLFTVVHELFMTHTARYADIVLPATSQLEHVDLHKAYGHHHLQYNAQAIAPIGEAKSSWDVMRLLAERLGFTEPWLRQTPEEIIAEVVDATARTNPLLTGITLERLQREGTVPYHTGGKPLRPFINGIFPTPDGKIHLCADELRAWGADPLPAYDPEVFPAPDGDSNWLVMVSGAAHHFVSSSMANVPRLMRKEGTPSIHIHPRDAERRGIRDGDLVEVSNERGACDLTAIITEDVRPGVVVAHKGQWGNLKPDGRGVNWLTSDLLADMGGGSTFHSTRIQLRLTVRSGQPRLEPVTARRPRATALAAAGAPGGLPPGSDLSPDPDR